MRWLTHRVATCIFGNRTRGGRLLERLALRARRQRRTSIWRLDGHNGTVELGNLSLLVLKLSILAQLGEQFVLCRGLTRFDAIAILFR